MLQTDIGFMKDKWPFLPGIFCDLAHSHHPSWCTPDPTSPPSVAADVSVPYTGDSSNGSTGGKSRGSSGRGYSMVSAGGGLSLRYVELCMCACMYTHIFTYLCFCIVYHIYYTM